MTEHTTSARVARLADLLGRMTDDPDRPARVAGEWRYAPLVDGAVSVGVWSATAETITFEDYGVDEAMLMLSGRLRLHEADGTVHELGPNDVFFIPKGWTGTWEIVEDMEKLYVIVG